jgi:glycosyltransferase involved in cell wall biosynthesis
MLEPFMREKTVAVIPAHNEERSIGEVVKGIKEHADEVIVLDDGSTDLTAQIANENGARVISNRSRMGLALTMIRCLEEALRRDAEKILTIDADGQYLPEDASKLLTAADDNDLVIGVRIVRYEMPLTKRIGNKAMSVFTTLLAGTHVKDSQSGFRVIRRNLAKTLCKFMYSGITYTQQEIVIASKMRYRIAEVPIQFYERKYGQSRLIRSLPGYVAGSLGLIIRTYRDFRPLHFFGSIGASLFLLGLLLGVWVTIDWSTTGYLAGIGKAILSVLLMTAGVQVVLFAFLADMVGTFQKRSIEERT